MRFVTRVYAYILYSEGFVGSFWKLCHGFAGEKVFGK